ncbi:MAG: hypothetical protein HYX78_11650 [Armatimonadetes bacterium]|nr:hypothetical protein [Armatimonadota bacterium]
MSTLEILLIVVLGTILLMWITIAVAVGVMIWRLRKAIFAVMLLLRGLSELAKQVQGLSRAVGEVKRKAG